MAAALETEQMKKILVECLNCGAVYDPKHVHKVILKGEHKPICPECQTVGRVIL